MRRISILLILLAISLPFGAARATMVLAVNLEQMTQLADRIFVGEVVAVVDAYDEAGRWCQYITFSTSEVYKGNVEKSLTIKQVNSKPVETADGTLVQSTLFRGVPQFNKGEDVLVFLHGDSAIGYTSPVGLAQGVFSITSDAKGQKQLVNGAGNRGLFRRMSVPAALQAQGVDAAQLQAMGSELSLDQMRSFIKILVGSSNEESR